MLLLWKINRVPQMNRVIISVCLCIAIMTSCKETKVEKTTRAEERHIFIGLIPEQNIFKQLERYQPLANYLSKKINVNAKLKVFTRYGNIVDHFVSAGLDAAFFGSFTYILAHGKLGVEAVARPESINGVSTYHGIIFIRKDSGIETAKDMKGKSFAFVDRATMAGYLLPLDYFKEHGIRDYTKFFKEFYFTGTHEGAIYDVLNETADIGAAKSTVFTRLASKDNRIRNELMIIKKSPDVPVNGLAVREDLDDSLKKQLIETLLNMHKDPDGIHVLRNLGAQRFIETTNDDYASVYEYAQKIGLNLATYHYWDE
jgi:phosphonate transport system substrate-binding protein